MKRVNLEPRKKPRQKRAAATVEAIIAAGFQVLGEGWSAFTTSRVAERAGVSVGTLYQYFPHREALLEAMLRGHRKRTLAVVRAALKRSGGSPFRARVRAVLHALVAEKRRAPALFRVLATELPPIQGLTQKRDVLPEIRDLMVALVREHAHELGAPGISELAIFTAVHAFEGACTRALEQPAHLASTRFEEMVCEMVLGMLVGTDTARPR